jgi:hypothetical protein
MDWNEDGIEERMEVGLHVLHPDRRQWVREGVDKVRVS